MVISHRVSTARRYPVNGADGTSLSRPARRGRLLSGPRSSRFLFSREGARQRDRGRDRAPVPRVFSRAAQDVVAQIARDRQLACRRLDATFSNDTTLNASSVLVKAIPAVFTWGGVTRSGPRAARPGFGCFVCASSATSRAWLPGGVSA